MDWYGDCSRTRRHSAASSPVRVSIEEHDPRIAVRVAVHVRLVAHLLGAALVIALEPHGAHPHAGAGVVHAALGVVQQ